MSHAAPTIRAPRRQAGRSVVLLHAGTHGHTARIAQRIAGVPEAFAHDCARAVDPSTTARGALT